MRPGFIAPRGTLERKPAHGQPCNRCGLCCVATLCPLGEHVFKQSRGPCPALHYKGELASCGLVVEPCRHALAGTLVHGEEAMREAAVLLIGSGTGCDARFNGEPGDEEFYAKLRETDRRNQGRMRRAKRLWKVPT